MHIREDGDGAWYSGYGWWIVNGTYGQAGSDGTNAWVDPAREAVVLVFTQTPDGANPIRRFTDLVNLSISDR